MEIACLEMLTTWWCQWVGFREPLNWSVAARPAMVAAKTSSVAIL
jgi:hypothetical protein